MIHMYKIVIVELRPPLAWWVILHIIKMSCCASFDLISTKVETPSHGFPRIVTLRAPKEWDLFSNHSGQLKYILKSQSTPLAKNSKVKKGKSSWKIVYIPAKHLPSIWRFFLFRKGLASLAFCLIFENWNWDDKISISNHCVQAQVSIFFMHLPLHFPFIPCDNHTIYGTFM